ncbi:MAG: AI-2E family transporter [Chthoniobacterales bacterium]
MDAPHDNDLPLTYRSARRVVGLVLLLAVAWLVIGSLRSILLLFAIVFLIAMVLNPIIVWLERRRIPRGLGVALILLALLIIAAILAIVAIPPFTAQVEGLIRRAPDLWHGVRGRFDALASRYPALAAALPETDELARKIGDQAGTVANLLVRSTIGFVGGVFSVLVSLLLLIFVLSNPEPLVAGYLALAPDRYRAQAHRTLGRLSRQMTAWVRGVAINGVVTGFTIGAGMWLIGVQPALVFGVMSFLGEFLPNIGAFLVAFPILFVALSMGATKFWLALAIVLFVYQVEVNLLVPIVLGKEMRLHPVNILFFTLAMASLFGVLGAILAVPAAALVQIVLDEFYLKPRHVDHAEMEREAAILVEGRSHRTPTHR